MSGNAAQAAPESDAPNGAPESETPNGAAVEPDDSTADEAGTDWKAASRQWERRAKRDAAALAAARAEADRVRAEARAEAEAAKADAARARLDALRVRVATDVGLPPDIADRLRGDDEAALRADAETLRARLRPGTGTPDAATGTGSAARGTPDLNTLFRIAAGRG